MKKEVLKCFPRRDDVIGKAKGESSSDPRKEALDKSDLGGMSEIAMNGCRQADGRMDGMQHPCADPQSHVVNVDNLGTHPKAPEEQGKKSAAHDLNFMSVIAKFFR